MKKFTSVKDIKDIEKLVSLARKLKKEPQLYQRVGKGKVLALLFFNPSLRTRLSVQKAAYNLGMEVMVMNLKSDGWTIEFEDGAIMNQQSQEHIREAAQVVSQYCDVIGIRTFPSLTNREDDYKERVLSKFIQYATVPVISLESATLHPLQSLADVITIREYQRKKKPKVVLTWAPHVKSLPQSVPNSFVEWVRELEVDLTIAHPKGFNLAPAYMEKIKSTENQMEAFSEADFIYAKNWSSFEQYGAIGCEFGNWLVTKEKMALTDNAKFMHCLPVRRNVVVTDKVLDGPNSLVVQQANNRTYAAQAVLANMLENEA